MNYNKDFKNVLAFLDEAEKLKTVLRHSWLSNGRRESVAEHTWRMALMAIIFYPRLRRKPNLLKVLKMVLVHDLAEVYAGDDWAWEKPRTDKHDREELGLKKIIRDLPGKQQSEFLSLWSEFEISTTVESRFAKALDKLEVNIQHLEAPIRFLNKKEFKFNLSYGYKYCQQEPVLKAFLAFMDVQNIKRYRKHKIDRSLYE